MYYSPSSLLNTPASKIKTGFQAGEESSLSRELILGKRENPKVRFSHGVYI